MSMIEPRDYGARIGCAGMPGVDVHAKDIHLHANLGLSGMACEWRVDSRAWGCE